MNGNEQKKFGENEFFWVEKTSMKLTEWIGTPISVVVHTIFFVGVFSLRKFGFNTDDILLILTTVVSLEAIYLAIFIQMTINRHEAKLHEVREDIKDISEDIEDIQENVEDLGEDVGEISEDIEEVDQDDDQKHAELNQKLEKIEIALQGMVKEIMEMRGKK